MFMPTTTSPPTADAEATRRAADAAYYREVLHELIETGRGLVRVVKQTNDDLAEAVEAMPAEEVAQQAAVLATAFDRSSRAIRRCIRLAQWLDDPARTHSARPAAAVKREREGLIAEAARHPDFSTMTDDLLERVDALDDDDWDEVARRQILRFGVAMAPAERAQTGTRSAPQTGAPPMAGAPSADRVQGARGPP